MLNKHSKISVCHGLMEDEVFISENSKRLTRYIKKSPNGAKKIST